MKYLAVFLLSPLLALVAAAVWLGLNFTVLAAEQGDEWLLVRNERAVECVVQGGCIVFSGVELMKAMQRFISQQRAPQISPRSQGAPT